ncbi:MAG TPA: radical SAM protein [Bacillota bacterium]|nr:radical SAM protein [Bacillota bacterium]
MTKYCNLHCRMCDYPEFYPTHQEISLAQIKQLLDETKMMGADLLELSGGEPMMRGDIFEIISYAKSLGFTVFMASNGVLIGPDEAERLVKSGLTFIAISLEGPEPVHDHIRGPGNFQKTLFAIKNLLGARSMDPSFRVGVGITLSKYNYQFLVPFSQYLLEKIGVQVISINPFLDDMLLEENRSSRSQEFNLTPDLLPALTDEINKLIKYSTRYSGDTLPTANYLRRLPEYFSGHKPIPPGGCRLPETFCGISTDGWVHVCWKNPPVGHLREMSLTEIYRSPRYLEFRKQALAGKCTGCLTACFSEIYS